MRFQNKTALITGAASGMGLLLAKCFAREGGSVVMADIDPVSLDRALNEVNGLCSQSAAGVVCDVRDYRQVCRARDEAVDKFGRIDLLVNFAGGAEMRMLNVTGYEDFCDVPIDVYDWSIDVNLKGQIYFDHAVMAQMRTQKSGVIINVGSITGEEGCALNIGYASAKSAAMNGLTKSIARAGAKYGVRCCCIAPGPVLTRPAMANMKTLMGYACEPQEIVDMVMFIASEQGRSMTGVTVLMDGGRNVM